MRTDAQVEIRCQHFGRGSPTPQIYVRDDLLLSRRDILQSPPRVQHDFGAADVRGGHCYVRPDLLLCTFPLLVVDT